MHGIFKMQGFRRKFLLLILSLTQYGLNSKYDFCKVNWKLLYLSKSLAFSNGEFLLSGFKIIFQISFDKIMGIDLSKKVFDF